MQEILRLAFRIFWMQCLVPMMVMSFRSFTDYIQLCLREQILENHAANKKFIGNLLGAIHLTSRHSALPPTALAYLLDTNEKNVNGTLADLEAVLLKDSSDNTIRVYHPSFLDYLGGNHLPSGLHYSGEELNAMIMKRCLKVLSEGLRFNICQLETSYVANNDLEDLQSRIKDNISPMLKYASLYWVDHLQDGKGGWSVQTQQTFESLLNGPKIIYWIEVLTLFGMVTQALFIMEKLKGQNMVCHITKQITRICTNTF